MQEDGSTLALGLQLAVAGGMMLLLTIVHALGLMLISHALGLRSERLDEMDFSWKALTLMCGMALLLFFLHALEIWIFAGLYLVIDAMQTLEEALYYSASAYATLGRTADYFPDNWRLLGAIEALIGFLLIGWSTAFMATKAGRLIPN